jgi:hypothetical protein
MLGGVFCRKTYHKNQQEPLSIPKITSKKPLRICEKPASKPLSNEQNKASKHHLLASETDQANNKTRPKASKQNS